MNRSLLLIVVAMSTWLEGGVSAYAVEVAPRITDREIIEGLAAIRGDIKRLDDNIKRLDEGQKTLQKQLDDTRHELKEFMLWGFGVTFSGIFALIGFVLWDRRTGVGASSGENKRPGRSGRTAGAGHERAGTTGPQSGRGPAPCRVALKSSHWLTIEESSLYMATFMTA